MSNIYKGYLKGTEKRAAESFKGDDSKLITYNAARKYDSFVGILADEFVMVDIDTEREAKLFLKIVDGLELGCSVLKTTKGIHAYFKGYELRKNSIEWYSAIGIQVTTKLGIKNTADPLRIDGTTRKWIRKCTVYDSLPKWLYPMDKKKNHIIEIEEGNRNQELFNYILKLQSVGMSKKEIRETIRIINQYVLKQSLDDSEINTILRDESFLKESFYKGNTFLHDKFAQFLIAEHNIILIQDVLHIYTEGIYSDDMNDIERAMIKHLPGLTKAKRLEVMSYLQITAPTKQVANPNFVAVQNGILNLVDYQLSDFDANIIIKNKIPVNYVSDAYDETTDKTLDKISVNDKALRKVLEEVFGLLLLRRNELGRLIILTGEGSNGKSSYLKMLKRFVGSKNTAALDLKELSMRFKPAELFGKLANIGDDISGTYIKESSELKKLTTGEALNVERKGRDPFDFSNHAKLIFSANKMPRINDLSYGLKRRLLIIPFNAEFKSSDEDFDPFIQDKLISDNAMEYVLQLAIAGLKRILDRNDFSPSKRIETEITKYEFDNNPVLGFIRDEQPKVENELVADVYRQYQVYCAENGYQAVASNTFSREINKNFKTETKVQKIDGKSKRIYASTKK